MDIHCAGFTFISNFDSGNLARVEEVTKGAVDNGASDIGVPDFEFNIWTLPDCAGTEFENGNRTWFYFGMKGGAPFALVKLNMVNLNRQTKMYSQGMAPVFRISPGRSGWERIRERPTFNTEDSIFTMSFKYRTLENLRATTYFAFTYPYSYSDLQSNLNVIDKRLLSSSCIPNPKLDDIYYHREPVCYSLEGRRVDLITISSYHNITTVREPILSNLFPESDILRPFQFTNKKIVFLSARVHPGETPSSFVLNGVLSLLLNRDDASAQALRRCFVFKLIPMLNPDGVARGHYRTDTRGVNLNRVYNNPCPTVHPSIYAARSLICYYHFGVEMQNTEVTSTCDGKLNHISNRVSGLSLDLSNNNIGCAEVGEERCSLSSSANSESPDEHDDIKENAIHISKDTPPSSTPSTNKHSADTRQSGLFLYVDLHGHASKKGIFMYGNHLTAPGDRVECMLFPKLMSLNSHHFHWNACNFSERNMYLRDKHGGQSREGCGRVAVLKATGLIRSYTLECNYNTGQIVNILPPTQRDVIDRRNTTFLVPPKYSPHIFEEVGKALCYSILDLTGANPNTRLYNSEYKNLCGLKEWLRKYINVTDSSANSKPLNQPVIQKLKDDKIISSVQTIADMENEGKEEDEDNFTSASSCASHNSGDDYVDSLEFLDEKLEDDKIISLVQTIPDKKHEGKEEYEDNFTSASSCTSPNAVHDYLDSSECLDEKLKVGKIISPVQTTIARKESQGKEEDEDKLTSAISYTSHNTGHDYADSSECLDEKLKVGKIISPVQTIAGKESEGKEEDEYNLKSASSCTSHSAGCDYVDSLED